MNKNDIFNRLCLPGSVLQVTCNTAAGFTMKSGSGEVTCVGGMEFVGSICEAPGN